MGRDRKFERGFWRPASCWSSGRPAHRRRRPASPSSVPSKAADRVARRRDSFCAVQGNAMRIRELKGRCHPFVALILYKYKYIYIATVIFLIKMIHELSPGRLIVAWKDQPRLNGRIRREAPPGKNIATPKWVNMSILRVFHEKREEKRQND